MNKLIVADVGWAKTIPKWLLNEVNAERMVNGMCNLIKKLDYTKLVGNAEVVVYLMTASLRAPLNRDMARIYLHLTSRLMVKVKKFKEGELPDFIKEEFKELSDYEKSQLNKLKYKIYNARGKEIKSPIFDILKSLKASVK